MAIYNRGMGIADVLNRWMDLDPQRTRTGLADAIGVSQPTVSRWLAGTDTPADKHVPALVEQLGLSEDQVLSAIHRQRLAKRSLSERVSDLEEQVRALTALVREIRAADG